MGNSAQGICDLAGNVWEWVQDEYENDYEGAPVDGSARGSEMDNGSRRVARGGAYDNVFMYIAAAYHGGRLIEERIPAIGFRLAR